MASVITTTRPHNTHIVISTSDDDDDGRSSPQARSMSSSLSSKYPHTNSYLSQLVSLYAPTTAASFSDDDLSPSKEQRLTATLFLPKVISLLHQDNEEELKRLFKDRLEIPDDLIESTILEIMHRHLNDQQQVPFAAAFVSTPKRPSRPSSRASTHSFRLESNSPASSPRAISFIHASTARRPHTPVTSSPLHINATTVVNSSISPASSPPILHASVTSLAKTSPTSSPLSSPRFLNAKEFRPRPADMHPLTRTLSAEHGGSLTLTRSLSVSSDQGRGTPSPDLWAHNPAAPTLTRTSSNLAIAAPLVIPSRSPTPGPQVATLGSRPNSRLGAPSRPPFEDDDDDEFSPFGKRINIQPSAAAAAATAGHGNKATSEEESSTSADAPPGLNALGGIGSAEDEPDLYPYPYPEHLLGGMDDQGQYLGGSGELLDGREGMTPFDVLQSVFGNSLAPGELEDALGRNGWDFEGTMQYLVDRQQRGQDQRGDGALPTPPPSQGQHLSSGYNAPYAAGPGRGGPAPGNYGHKVMVVSREQISFMRGGRPGAAFPSGPMPRQQQFGGPGVRGGRVCRYFLAGECRRADCRFSHDLDRALCRFWLRGICAKGDQCEFMHRLPNGVQLEGGAVPGAPGFRDGPPGNGYLQPGGGYGGGPTASFTGQSASPPPGMGQGEMDDEEFPALGSTRSARSQQHQPPFTVDPSKNRFARQAAESQLQTPPLTSTHNPNGRPSSRTILRPPTQLSLASLANLPTTENTSSKTYQAYRERPVQLSAARNACLARAADAWRRGDVQLAKRFTREGHELNAKMRLEGREGGRKVVLEWVEGFREELDGAPASSAHKNTASSVSDGDGWERGEAVAHGLGVCLGHAPGGAGEVYVDLRGLFVDEGIELLEEYLMVLERDGFTGLAYVAVGEDPTANDVPPNRLSGAVKEWCSRWAYPWMEVDVSAARPGAGGMLCIDPLTHSQ